MKFNQLLPEILKGTTARRAAEVTALDGKTLLKMDQRLLMPEDDAAIEEAACDFAIAHKVKDPKPGNSQYERGLMLNHVFRSCVDQDVTTHYESFFESVEQIGKYIDDSRVALLMFQQRAFQAEVGPNPTKGCDPIEFISLLYASNTARLKGEDPSLPFVGLPSGKLILFSTEAVRLLCSLLPQGSDTGSSNQGGSGLSQSFAERTDSEGPVENPSSVAS